ncbi:MAG TPA: COX15/CtaA family protein [Solirubrobacteraceae bacterium]|nr:COX15/CtaA family protein [Solirubrobacteraceae bacterium]
MAARLDRFRERTNGYTVTPAQYARVAYVALGALTLIVLTGAAVRLTGSGLGCPDWPKCYGNAYPPLNAHAVIEFSNRVITAPVSIAALAATVLAFRRRPYRRDLAVLGLLLPLGVLGQAVLGGFTVRRDLDYGFVMGHFALSMLILVAAALLAWQATHEPDERPRQSDRTQVWSVRALVALSGLTIFAGTAATASGPHAGGAPGQRINRLDFDGKGTMDFVIHRHGEIGLVFGLVAVGVWLLLRRRQADPVLRRAVSALCVLTALQGAIGLDQYKTHLPAELVWVHVGLACGVWLLALWAGCAAGRLPSDSPKLGPSEAGNQASTRPVVHASR